MNENEVQVFMNEVFGEIRILEQNDGKVLFCGKDVALALKYSNTNEAITRHCKEDGVVKHDLIDSLGRTQEASFITEGNLYRLITHSRRPDAEKFERWVFDDVLPSIRKHGAYMTEQTLERALTSPDFLIELATQLKTEQEQRRRLETTVAAQSKQMEQDKPKVLFADSVAASSSSILIGELAKLIKQNGVDMGQRRLFAWMRENGYLIKRCGSEYNLPTQRSMERGLMEIKETSVIHSGYTTISKTPKVTGKGQVYFINLLVGQRTE